MIARRSRSSVLGLVLSALLVVPAAGFVLQRTVDDAPEQRVELTAARGAVAITSSHDGTAILDPGAMRPGQTSSGVIRIDNAGDVASRLTLSAGDLVERPGPDGGRLSERLRLRVEDLSGAGRTVYEGTLTGLGTADAGVLAVGEARSYRFAVTFPDGGADGADNAFQGSTATMGFLWAVTGPQQAPSPTPAPTPAPSPRPAPVAPEPAAPAAGETAGESVSSAPGEAPAPENAGDAPSALPERPTPCPRLTAQGQKVKKKKQMKKKRPGRGAKGPRASSPIAASACGVALATGRPASKRTPRKSRP